MDKVTFDEAIRLLREVQEEFSQLIDRMDEREKQFQQQQGKPE